MTTVYRILELDERPRSPWKGSICFEDFDTRVEAEEAANRIVSQFWDARVTEVEKGSPFTKPTVREFKMLPLRARCGHDVSVLRVNGIDGTDAYVTYQYVDPDDLFTTICPECFEQFIATGVRSWRES